MTHLILAAGTAHSHPGRLLLALAPLLVVAIGFDAYCLVSLVRARSVRYLPKVVWGIIIVLISFPLGGLLYLFVGRVRNQASGVPG
jgi:Phospholipase_D-nuclease N-terminal